MIEKNSLKQTVLKMVPAVLTALLATALGFIALYSSPVPMIQDFGKMLTIGMVISFFVGLFILIPILFTRDYFFTIEIEQKKTTSKKPSKFESGLATFTRKIISIKWLIIFLAFLTAGIGIWGDLNTRVETDVETFMPQETEALKDIHKLRDIIGTTDQVSIMYNSSNVLDEEVITWTDHITSSLKKDFPNVIVETKSITSILKRTNNGKLPKYSEINTVIQDIPQDQLKLLINEDSTKAVITVGIKHLEGSKLKDFIQSLEVYMAEKRPTNIDTTITGKSVLDVEMVSALTTGRYKMTLLGMVLVFLGLFVLYRHPIKAVIPLLPILFIVGWSGGIMYLFDIQYTPLTATLGALIIGIGTEFTILVMERFYEERKNGVNSIEAVIIANKKIGKAIFASAFTTIGGFSSLLISDFVILSNFGMMTLINIVFALISTIVVLPTILVLLDRFIKTKQNSLEREAVVG